MKFTALIVVLVAAIAANVGFLFGQASRSSEADAAAAKAARAVAVKDSAAIGKLTAVAGDLGVLHSDLSSRISGDSAYTALSQIREQTKAANELLFKICLNTNSGSAGVCPSP